MKMHIQINGTEKRNRDLCRNRPTPVYTTVYVCFVFGKGERASQLRKASVSKSGFGTIGYPDAETGYPDAEK